MAPTIKIKPMSLAENRFCDGRKFWLTTSLIERSKGLEPFDCPLAALMTGYEIWNGANTIQGLAGHCRRVLDADFSHPIILGADGSLMDGGHRIAKAILEGREFIKAVRFDETPPHDGEEAE